MSQKWLNLSKKSLRGIPTKAALSQRLDTPLVADVTIEALSTELFVMFVVGWDKFLGRWHEVYLLACRLLHTHESQNTSLALSSLWSFTPDTI
jgi:hypothetical protein